MNGEWPREFDAEINSYKNALQDKHPSSFLARDEDRRNPYKDALHGRQPSPFEMRIGAVSEAVASIADFFPPEKRRKAEQVLAAYERMGNRAGKKVGLTFPEFYVLIDHAQKKGVSSAAIRRLVVNCVDHFARFTGSVPSR